MATDDEHARLVGGLGAPEWATVLSAIAAVIALFRDAPPPPSTAKPIVDALARLANHPKWEIRRGVADAAGQLLDASLEPAITKLLTDDNARVRHGAERSMRRRRDWQHASTLGRQHEERINATLDDIEARFGARGRDAVKRAAEELLNTFARELYHEVIKVVSPLAMSAERLESLLSPAEGQSELAAEAARVRRRVDRLRAVLDAMRAYAEQPSLSFSNELLREVLDEAVALVLDGRGGAPAPAVVVDVSATLTAAISRPRILQALVNILTNSIESYAKTDPSRAIAVRAAAVEGHLEIIVADQGCGMDEQALVDARVLFATSKPGGTGFGLPLAVKIVESEHRGRLLLESNIGRGTTVRILLPVSQA